MRAYLVQRLLMPRERVLENPFGPFGMMSGQHGGFTDESWKEIKKVFEFEYMGAAEYEHGDCPKAMQAIWQSGQDGQLVWGEVAVKFPTFEPNLRYWFRHHRDDPKNKVLTDGAVFCICRWNDRQAVRRLVRRIALGRYRQSRDPILLDYALRQTARKPGDLAGWLGIDNFFMFFIDREMFEKTLKLLAPKSRPKRPTTAQPGNERGESE